MDRREQLALAARDLSPLRQGQLDGLCGLYSILNAVRLVLHPKHRLRKRQLDILFAAGLKVLNRERRLTAIVSGGISEELWLALCDSVINEANVLLGTRLQRKPLAPERKPPHVWQLISRIRHSIDSGCPVLVIVYHVEGHATVIAGYTDTRLTSFDSVGWHWLNTRSLGAAEGRSRKPRRVSVTSASYVVDLAPGQVCNR